MKKMFLFFVFGFLYFWCLEFWVLYDSSCFLLFSLCLCIMLLILTFAVLPCFLDFGSSLTTMKVDFFINSVCHRLWICDLMKVFELIKNVWVEAESKVMSYVFKVYFKFHNTLEGFFRAIYHTLPLWNIAVKHCCESKVQLLSFKASLVFKTVCTCIAIFSSSISYFCIMRPLLHPSVATNFLNVFGWCQLTIPSQVWIKAYLFNTQKKPQWQAWSFLFRL